MYRHPHKEWRPAPARNGATRDFGLQEGNLQASADTRAMAKAWHAEATLYLSLSVSQSLCFTLSLSSVDGR